MNSIRYVLGISLVLWQLGCVANRSSADEADKSQLASSDSSSEASPQPTREQEQREHDELRMSFRALEASDFLQGDSTARKSVDATKRGENRELVNRYLKTELEAGRFADAMECLKKVQGCNAAPPPVRHAFTQDLCDLLVQAAEKHISQWSTEAIGEAAMLSEKLMVNPLSHTYYTKFDIGLLFYLHLASGKTQDLIDWIGVNSSDERNRDIGALNVGEFVGWAARHRGTSTAENRANRVVLVADVFSSLQQLGGCIIQNDVVLATNRYGSIAILKPFVDLHFIAVEELSDFGELLGKEVSPPDLAWSALADQMIESGQREEALHSLDRAIALIPLDAKDATAKDRRTAWLRKRDAISRSK